MSQSAAENTYLEVFESISAHSSSAVNKLRREGLENFASLGFPTTDLERWRFTNVSPIAKKQFELTYYDIREEIIDKLPERMFIVDFDITEDGSVENARIVF